MGQDGELSLGPAPGVFADVYDELPFYVCGIRPVNSGTVEVARTGARLSRLGSQGVSVVDSRTVAGALRSCGGASPWS